jgi:uncharacterized protein with HEPN domain
MPTSPDNAEVVVLLEQVVEALERIPPRVESIETAAEFSRTAENRDRLDAICMTLIACGEAVKRVDRLTGGCLLARYPQVDWKGVKGVRDVIAHGYFDIDEEEIHSICVEDIPSLIETVHRMLDDLRQA